MNNNTKTILAVIAGGAVGFAIATLLAPDKGSKTRASILGAINDLGEKLGEVLAEGKDKVTGIADRIQSETRSIKEDIQLTVDHGKKIVS